MDLCCCCLGYGGCLGCEWDDEEVICWMLDTGSGNRDRYGDEDGIDIAGRGEYGC